MRNGRKHEGSASYRMNHRQHPDVIQSVAVAYAVLFLKLENIGLNKIKVSEMGKYFDVLRIICHTQKHLFHSIMRLQERERLEMA